MSLGVIDFLLEFGIWKLLRRRLATGNELQRRLGFHMHLATNKLSILLVMLGSLRWTLRGWWSWSSASFN